ncbi:peptide ABC transporter substrate-binding protein, partial [Turicibacter sanguinis]|nr:peptide ABC transporter substrate-binding protein [Turicibacter sanguinis]
LDVSAVNAQSVGEELKEISVRNLITQPDFVQTSYHQTYGELVGDSLKRLNPMLYPENFTVEDGQMSYFNPGLAKELMQVAKAELMEQGVDFPVYLDVLINGESEMSFRSAQALKNSLETELKGDVVINLITTSREHLAATKSASLVNTDLYFATAWSPDYGDPKSYMDILDPKQGDMLKYFGLNQAVIETEEDRQIKEQIGLNKFGYLKQAASDVVNDPDLRYELYAQAEAFAIDQAYFIPLSTSGGSYAVSKIIPYTKPYSSYGLSTMKFKGMQISDHIITVVERNQYKEQWIQKRNQIAPSINVDKILP